MAKGKVESINFDTKKAFIGGKEVQLGKKLFNPKLPFAVGDTIEYNIKGSNFEYLKNLSSLGVDTTPPPRNNGRPNNNSGNFGGGTARAVIGKCGNFSYPYNFVSLGEKNSIKRAQYSKGNLSGIIECEITTKTPIMITGMRKESNLLKGHYEEYFYKEDGKYLIPASGLKGAIRNVFDSLTNSCIRGVEDERLEKRYSAGDFNDRKFGIITKLPTDTTPGIIVEASMIKISNSRKFGSALPQNFRREGIYTEHFSEDIFKFANPKIVPGSDGKPTYDRAIRNEGEFNRVLSNSRNGRKGIIWVSSEIVMKSYDKILIAKADAKEFKFSKEDYEDLKYLLDQRDERERDNGKSFYYADDIKEDKNELKEWFDPIIFKENPDKTVSLAFSEIPRLRYKYSPADLVPKEFHSCSSNENLCPSCNLFGMVETEAKENKENKESNLNNSLAGRVSFSDAYLEGAAKEIRNKLIKSLGEPHPTLTGFYLTDVDGYDNRKGNIRGRKFYWHHPDKIDKSFESYYKKCLDPKTPAKHNSTINCLDKDNRFRFKVQFKNLDEKELEALVYAIELEEGMLHKFGKAKAFGFGSCDVKINRINLDDNRASRNNFTKIYLEKSSKEYIENFKKRAEYSSNSMKELRKILNQKASPELDFSNSPFPEDTDKKGELNTLNWFMNKKSECKKAKVKFTLPNILEYI